jgi:hypothetical protein
LGSDGQVAQLVEQRIENPRVGGSIPPLATRFTSAARKSRRQVPKTPLATKISLESRSTLTHAAAFLLPQDRT